jgi:serine/threonine protein kinase
MGLVELLTHAVELAEAVAAVHGRGVVHKDINPGNILLSGVPRRPSLIDFGLAMTFAEERPGFVHADLIAGTLVYLAPEQTGRSGRSVDHRADVYSLGATLYEAATGMPPFGTDDPLRLIHDHLARWNCLPPPQRRLPDWRAAYAKISSPANTCPDYDVRAMLRHLLQEVVLHSWDLANAVLHLLEDGSDPMRLDDWYAPPVPVHGTADALERAVARSGGDPGWLPPPTT